MCIASCKTRSVHRCSLAPTCSFYVPSSAYRCTRHYTIERVLATCSVVDQQYWLQLTVLVVTYRYDPLATGACLVFNKYYLYKYSCVCHLLFSSSSERPPTEYNLSNHKRGIIHLANREFWCQMVVVCHSGLRPQIPIKTL